MLTLYGRWARLRGRTVCRFFGHRPALIEISRLVEDPPIEGMPHRPGMMWPLKEVSDKGAYCRRCLSHVGD